MKNTTALRRGVTLFAALVAALLALSAAAHERGDVHASAQDAQPLLPGMKAPAFELTAADGSKVSFVPGQAERPVVLTFYRGGWCPFCNMHLFELRGTEVELREIGADGMIHFQYTNTDYAVRLDPEVLLSAARTFMDDTDARLKEAYKRRNP